jgi:hypothetical protein
MEGTLSVDSGGKSGMRGRERGTKGIPYSLEDVAAIGLYSGAKD